MIESEIPILCDSECWWGLTIPSEADTCREEVEELNDLLDVLYDAWDGLIRPTEATFPVQRYPPRSRIPDPREDRGFSERLGTEDRSIARGDGISLADFQETMALSEDADPYVQKLTISRCDVRLRTDGGNAYVNRSVAVPVSVTGEEMDRDPETDLLEVVLLHAPDSEKPRESDFVFQIRVELFSDIWFGSSDSTEINRKRLSEMFQRMDSNLDVRGVQRHSNISSIADMRDIY